MTYQSVPTLLVSFSLVDEDTTAIKSEQHFEHVSLQYQFVLGKVMTFELEVKAMQMYWPLDPCI